MSFDKDKEIDKLKRRIAGLEKTLQIVSGYSGRVEKNLKQLFDVISDTVPVPMLISSESGKIFFSNGKAQDIFGYPEEIFHRLNASALYENPEDQHAVLKMIIEKGETRGFPVRLKKADGAVFPASFFSQQIVFEGHNCFLTVVYDLSEIRLEEEKRLAIEKQLRYIQKMEAIGTLAGGIAHDFNNILFPIMGYAEMTMADLPKESKTYQNILEIYKASIRAGELVNQILAFSRQHEHEKMKLKIQPIIKEALKLIRSTLPSTIRIIQKIDPNCSPIIGDPTQIHQIIMNLCTNAFHATRDTGGIVEISLTETELGADDMAAFPGALPGTYLKLSVSDTGVGMPKDILERIFDPFFTTKPVGVGTGLGLSVVHGIVKQMDGHIRVFSEPGKGTLFVLYFPAIKTENTYVQTSSASDRPIQTGSERILLIDDEKSILDMLRQMLEELGYRVVAITDSMEAFRVFQSEPDIFDLVITDMTMPDMTGAQLAEKLLRIRPDIPIILCTGFSEQIDEKKSEAIGIRGYLMKPVVRSNLAKTIRKILNGEKKKCFPIISESAGELSEGKNG